MAENGPVTVEEAPIPTNETVSDAVVEDDTTPAAENPISEAPASPEATADAISTEALAESTTTIAEDDPQRELANGLHKDLAEVGPVPAAQEGVEVPVTETETEAQVVEDGTPKETDKTLDNATTEEVPAPVSENVQAVGDDVTPAITDDLETSVVAVPKEAVLSETPVMTEEPALEAPSEAEVPQVVVIASATPRIAPLKLGDEDETVNLEPVPVVLPPPTSASSAFPDIVHRGVYETVPVSLLSPREELSSLSIPDESAPASESKDTASSAQDGPDAALASSLASATDLPSAIEQLVNSGLTPSAEALLDAVQESLMGKLKESDDEAAPVAENTAKVLVDEKAATTQVDDEAKDVPKESLHVAEASTASDATLVTEEASATEVEHSRTPTLQEDVPEAKADATAVVQSEFGDVITSPLGADWNSVVDPTPADDKLAAVDIDEKPTTADTPAPVPTESA